MKQGYHQNKKSPVIKDPIQNAYEIHMRMDYFPRWDRIYVFEDYESAKSCFEYEKEKKPECRFRLVEVKRKEIR